MTLARIEQYFRSVENWLDFTVNAISIGTFFLYFFLIGFAGLWTGMQEHNVPSMLLGAAFIFISPWAAYGLWRFRQWFDRYLRLRVP